MATSNTAIVKEAAAAGAAAERATLKEKAKAAYVAGLEKTVKSYRSANNALKNAPQPVNVGIGIGTGALAAVGGFKIQKALAKTTAEWVTTAEQFPTEPDKVGKPTGSAKLVKDAMVPLLGVGMFVGGAFLKHPTISAVVMGAGGGLATGSVISSAVDPTP